VSSIQNSNFVFFVVNELIKGEIEKPTGYYLSLIVMSHWFAMVWIQIQEILIILLLYLFVCRITFAYLMCVGDRCDMMDSDKDLGRSRRPSAHDRWWSSIGRILGDWMIGRSGDAVCGLHRAHKDEECVFLGWASKLRSMGFSVWDSKPAALIWWFGSQNHCDGFLTWASKLSRLRLVDYATKLTEECRQGTRVEI
jgi:hypothetical protein